MGAEPIRLEDAPGSDGHIAGNAVNAVNANHPRVVYRFTLTPG